MDQNEKIELKSSRDMLVRELESAGAQFRGNACRCPFCDDRNPSAGVYESGGGWSFKCHKCGFHGDIFSVMAINQNCTEVEIFKSMNKPKEIRKTKRFSSVNEAEQSIRNHKATFRYFNPDTKKVDMFVFRIEEPGKGKRFLQGTHDGNGGVILKSPNKPWPLYGRKSLKQAKHVIVVEGEKAVHAIHGIDKSVSATTNPGGAGKAKYTDWTPLVGKKVYLWPDNDPPGKNGKRAGFEHMKEVSGILENLTPAPELYWIDPENLNLPEKGDSYEFFQRFKTNEQKTEQLHALLSSACPAGASSGVVEWIEDAIAGKRETIRLPWYGIDKATMALTPGSVTLLCGDGGAAKSLAILQLCQYWHFTLKHDVVIYELEEDKQYHIIRALAQKVEEPRLINDRWIKENPEIARKHYNRNMDFINEMGRMIYEAPVESVSLSALAEWVEEQAGIGKRIICIDPITAATATKDVWIADQDFMSAVKKSIVNHGASLVLVTHPKKGGGNVVGMDSLAGGACWARFSQSIMWLKNFGQEKDIEIVFNGVTNVIQADREMSVLKARNSFGGGRSFAMNLINLSLVEEGELVRSKK